MIAPLLFYVPFNDRRLHVRLVPAFGHGYCAMVPAHGESSATREVLYISGGPFCTLVTGILAALRLALAPASAARLTMPDLTLYAVACMSSLCLLTSSSPALSERVIPDFQWLWWLLRPTQARACVVAFRGVSALLVQGVRPRDLQRDRLAQAAGDAAPVSLRSHALMYRYYHALDSARPADALACLYLLGAKMRRGQAVRTVATLSELAYFNALYRRDVKRAAAVLTRVQRPWRSSPAYPRALAARALQAGEWEAAIAYCSAARRRLALRCECGLAMAEEEWLHTIEQRARAELNAAQPQSLPVRDHLHGGDTALDNPAY